MQIGCKLADVYSKGNEPFLAVFVDAQAGRPEEKQVEQLLLCCEKKELCEIAAGFVKAVCTLICSYYAFNVCYNKGKSFLFFMEEFLLGKVPTEKRTSRYCQLAKQINSLL